MKFLLPVLAIFGLMQAAFADTILLMNKSGRELTQLEIKFENSDGVFTLHKLDKLDASGKHRDTLN